MEVWLPVVIIYVNNDHCKTMSDLPSNDRKMTSRNNLTLRFSKRSLDLVRVFFVSIWCDLITLAASDNYLSENWLLLNKEYHIGGDKTEK